MATTETQVLIEHLETLSYAGIFFASILSNVIIPVPEEIVVIAFGYIIGTGKVSALIVIPIIIAGMLLGDIAMYALSRNHNKIVTGFYNRFFAKLIASRKDWVETHIKKVIFFSRFLIQLRFIGPFMAGQSRTKWKTFIAYDLLALLIYVPFYTLVGWYFRNRIAQISSGVNELRNIVILAVIVLVLIAVGKVLRDVFFRGHVLSFKGRKSEKTWLGFVYKRKPKKELKK